MRGWFRKRRRMQTTKPLFIGGSFGTVYKAIEKETGELVAIKHVSDCLSFMSRPIRLISSIRSTSNLAKMTFKKSSKKSPYLLRVLVPT